jgi:hypothetical protein
VQLGYVMDFLFVGRYVVDSLIALYTQMEKCAPAIYDSDQLKKTTGYNS